MATCRHSVSLNNETLKNMYSDTGYDYLISMYTELTMVLVNKIEKGEQAITTLQQMDIQQNNKIIAFSFLFSLFITFFTFYFVVLGCVFMYTNR